MCALKVVRHDRVYVCVRGVCVRELRCGMVAKVYCGEENHGGVMNVNKKILRAHVPPVGHTQ